MRIQKGSLTGALIVASVLAGSGPALAQCTNTVTADVVALNQPFFYNRLGAWNPAGMIFALVGDVEPITGTSLGPGNVRLKAYKRPRPIVLRVNAGDCLAINFTNLLNPVANTSADEPATRSASIHAMGMQLVGGIGSDGSNVGRNASSLVSPGGTATYTFYAEREGGYLLHSTGATTGGEGNGGSLAAGLFGTVNVEPPGTVWYRSQVTAEDLALATTGFTPKTVDTSGVLVSGGQPILNYAAVYPAGNLRAGLPILEMTQGGKIVHSDLNAIIAGPGGTRIPTTEKNGYTYYNNTPQNPDRNQPFREFTVVFHDEITAVQAFDEFRHPVLSFPLHSVRDGFAINYGTGGVGAEILANRKGVGPMKDCTECKYEEFFLTSWVVGDPAMVVDIPANVSNPAAVPPVVATQAFYPDDPSNVHHSYLNDHVKFRNIHAGPKEHHIFHLHAHQWVQTPDSPGSTYLDSQAIGPGASFTYEITYNGSGNRNKTVGDSIFHCHFYPHFAQGMWELWRSHDVFEDGTRMLPDGEIVAGTPIPALVPLPSMPMAPMPGTMGNDGYPFFMADATKIGHRPPTPPLDIAYDLSPDADGGLPRHIITGCAPGTEGTTACLTQQQTRLDFDKTLHAVTAKQIPESGTPLEQIAMAYHSVRQHPTFLPDGTPGATFTTNGMPRKVASPTNPNNPIEKFGAQRGAPFADPCVSDLGEKVGAPRTYKAAAIQLDITLNKAGWHFGQSRMLSLWDDAEKFANKSKPPEPFFFRANTNECITFYHTNLVPNFYAQDDFQVRTPTDILGQHIHLVKFDVTSSDGSGNGFNYEDGTLSYGEIDERIKAINAGGTGAWTPVRDPAGLAPDRTTLACTSFGPAGVTVPCTRTTVQRWFADDTMGLTGDKTLRTVFTHDHYGPSTHQQAGLYASLVIEPAGSTWWHNERQDEQFGTRTDGGPTSWQARIKSGGDEWREFMFQFADFQLAYRPDGIPGTPVNPPARNEVPLTAVPASLATVAANCPGGEPRPCPEAISADDVGTASVNYRNEPVALRVRNASLNQQETGQAGDLSFAYASIARPNSGLDRPDPYPPLTGGVRPNDPYTPLLRAYENDKIQLRVQVGATEEGHNLSVHGMKWMHEPSWSDSGYRNSQMIGISEHFEMLVPSMGAVKGSAPFNDYKYQVGSSAGDLWNGIWGLIRAYQGPANGEGLPLLASNPKGTVPPADPKNFNGVCPATAPVRKFSITAITAQQALSGRTPAGTVVYNSRADQGGILHDPTAILFVRSNDLDSTGLKLNPGVPVEPLILRANAGDCISVTLTNKLPAALPDAPGLFTLPMLIADKPGAVDFNANQIAPSSQVGLHPQMLTYDVSNSDGANVGFNPVFFPPQTAGPGGTTTYKWYAGEIRVDSLGNRTAIPMEYGALNLVPADPIKHPSKGAIGALIIEPAGSCFGPTTKGPGNDPCGEDVTLDAKGRVNGGTRASATIRHTETNGVRAEFREFVVLFQNSVNLQRGTGLLADPALPRLAQAEDPEDSGSFGFNFRTEPMWKRMGFEPDRPLTGPGGTLEVNFTNALSNSQVGGDPQTPVFTAAAGTPVWFRVLHPGGVGRNNVFQVHGDGWQEQPYFSNSTRMGYNPGGICPTTPCNTMSEYKGSQYGIGPTSHNNFILKSAGGREAVMGDFLYRDQSSYAFDGGLWGIFRVCATLPCPVTP